MKRVLVFLCLAVTCGCSSPTAPAPYNPAHFNGLLGAWKSDRPVTDSEYFILNAYAIKSEAMNVIIRIFTSPDTLKDWGTVDMAHPARGVGASFTYQGYGTSAASPFDSMSLAWSGGTISAYPHGDTLRAHYSRQVYGPIDTFDFIRIPAIDSII